MTTIYKHTAAALCLATGIALAGWFISNAVFESRTSDRYVSVKGLAEKLVIADRAVWTIHFISAHDNLSEASQKLSSSRKAVKDFLGRHNIPDTDTEIQNLRVVDMLARPYQSGQVPNRYLLEQSILVRSSDIQNVTAASQQVNEMLEAGVVLGTLDGHSGNGGPHYLFTRLNDIKPDLIAEATANARVAAQKFAQDADTKIKAIKHAQQGRFQILSAENAPGLVQTQQIHKKVRVVTSIDYILQH